MARARQITTQTITVKPVIEPVTLAAPDTTELDRKMINYPKATGFVIDNDEANLAAQKHMGTLKELIDYGHAVLDPPCKTAHAIHGAFTGLRSFFLDGMQREYDSFKDKVLGWAETQRRIAIAKAQQEERERVERLRADQERINEAARLDQERLKNEMPWAFDDDQEPEPAAFTAAIVIPEPVERYMPAPVISTAPGFGFRNLPLSFKVENIELLIIECAKRLQADPKDTSLLPFLTVDERAVKAKLGECGEAISAVVPGIVAFRGQTASVK